VSIELATSDSLLIGTWSFIGKTVCELGVNHYVPTIPSYFLFVQCSLN